MPGAVIDILLPGDSAKVRALYDRIEVHRAPTRDGQYAEVTTPDTRIALEPDRQAYQYVDKDAPDGAWFRFRFRNSVSTAQPPSSFSASVLGAGDTALDVISVNELKTIYLFGLDLTDPKGTPFPASLYEHFIRSAVDYLETRTDVSILPRTILGERHNFQAWAWQEWGEFNLHRVPIASVQAIRLKLPGQQSPIVIPSDWISPRGGTSQKVHVVPGSGGFSALFATGGTWWTSVLGSGIDFVPNALEVDYTAGFASGTTPAFVKDLVGKIASFGPLNIAGDLIGGAGIASFSLSLDGLSESVQTTSSPEFSGFGARLRQYQLELKDAIPSLRNKYHSIAFGAS